MFECLVTRGNGAAQSYLGLNEAVVHQELRYG